MHPLQVTHPDKLLFSEIGLTKKSLVQYYRRIAPILLPYLANRPLTFRQCPHGVDHESFIRKHIPTYFPGYVKRVDVARRDSSKPCVTMATADEEDDLTYFANQNVVELHITGAQIDNLECPDQIVFDLDPMDEDFERVRVAAFALKELLDSHRAPSFVKTSGRNGLHIHVPLTPKLTYEQIKPWVTAIGHQLCQRLPVITTEEHLRRKRGHKVYVGTLRNNYAQTVIAPYSVRALSNAAIATPIDWTELKRRRVQSQSWNIQNIFRRLANKQDPWREMRQYAIDPHRLLDGLAHTSISK